MDIVPKIIITVEPCKACIIKIVEVMKLLDNAHKSIAFYFIKLPFLVES